MEYSAPLFSHKKGLSAECCSKEWFLEAMLAKAAACRGSKQESTKIVNLWVKQLNNDLVGVSPGFQSTLQHLFVCMLLYSLTSPLQTLFFKLSANSRRSLLCFRHCCCELPKWISHCSIKGWKSLFSHDTNLRVSCVLKPNCLVRRGAGGFNVPDLTPWGGHKGSLKPVVSMLSPELIF